MPNDHPNALTIPLARWAGGQLRQLAEEAGSKRISKLTGETLLGERAAINGFVIPRRRSAGGGCRFYAADDGWIALNLARPLDRELLPALFGDALIDYQADAAIASRISAFPCAYLLTQGRDLGLAIASTREKVISSPVTLIAEGQQVFHRQEERPLVVDLSALWAGPLVGHLLWLAGAEVVKVESRARPDSMRQGEPDLFAMLNQGKASVLADLATAEGRTALNDLLFRADIVIEAARPRALCQLGIDAENLLRVRPGLIWLTITSHGASGSAANWVGFGDDCGVAGGLSAALELASGAMGFVGDAIADPLTGIVAAREVWRHWQAGNSCRVGISMSSVVASALAEEQSSDRALLDAELAAWANSVGTPFPVGSRRMPEATLRSLGADTLQWLGEA